ncbi:hypothetical protein QQF64_009671 [Cirrhinus molitorella]|uniref:Uncharacterized protein n=2 Tax=Cirrhinus molitorella TaxID=172907 RepID=A0ABR3M587_9TELE|nr:hypothetical protein Q8A67_008085 [Cirrhinus molitorella]
MSQSVSCENTLLLSVLRQACANTQPHSYTQTVGLRLSLRGSNRASPLRALFKGLSCTVQRSFRRTCSAVSVCSPSLSLLLLSARVLPEVMNAGICVCVLLAALSTSSCLSLPTHSENGGQSDLGTVAEHTRHTRAAPSSGQLSLLSKPEDDEEPRSSLTELLARIISTKGTYRRSPSTNSRPVGNTHRIKDRDYLGWMDFGRRSAEEYEYSS